MSVEDIFEDHYEDLSINAQLHLTKLHEWYTKHYDEFLPKGVILTNDQMKVLIYNVSLLSAWAIDGHLPNRVIDTDIIPPLSDN